MCRNTRPRLIISFAVALLLIGVSLAAAEKVARVIDGDTIKLSSGTLIRYIGVDSPEPRDQSAANYLFAKQAAAYNALLVLDKEVRLEYDVERHDRHGRTLAYVYVDDIFVNEEMVRTGWAQVMTVAPNVRHVDTFTRHEAAARQARVGLWVSSETFTPQMDKLGVKATDGSTVLVTESGTKYHKKGCRYLAKSAIPITLDAARSQGYKACSVCGG